MEVYSGWRLEAVSRLILKGREKDNEALFTGSDSSLLSNDCLCAGAPSQPYPCQPRIGGMQRLWNGCETCGKRASKERDRAASKPPRSCAYHLRGHGRRRTVRVEGH